MGWMIGYVVGGVVVLAVVVLLLLMIAGARKITTQAEAILEALHSARDRSAGMWAIGDANAALERIVGSAVEARQTLEAQSR